MTEVGHRLSNCELILLIMKIRIRPKGIFSFRHNPDRMMLLTAQDNNNTNVKFNISYYEDIVRADGLRNLKGGFEDIDGFRYNMQEIREPFQVIKGEKVVLYFMPDSTHTKTLKNLTDKDKLIELYDSVMRDAEPAKCRQQIEGGRSSRKTRKTRKAKKTHKSRKAKKTHKSRKPRKAKKTHRRRKSRRVNKTHKRK